MISESFDVAVIGAGLVGLSTAFHIQKQYPDKRVLLLEKESTVAKHQSGHNSGVIHSGIYYKPGSIKARNCVEGYHSIIAFAEEHGIPYEICGKIIVATSANELPILESIYQRGIENGLQGLRKLSPAELKEQEPHVAGLAGIQVPQTGIIDYPGVADRLLTLFTTELGGTSIFNTKLLHIYKSRGGLIAETSRGAFSVKKLVSCAGLHSDRVASLTEADNDLRIIPFRGEYYKLSPEKEGLVRNLIYPVPDPNFPFLGVHFTRMISGGVEAGPNAVLAFKREGYTFSAFSPTDLTSTLTWPGFWKVVAKYGRTGMGEIYRSLSKAAFTRALQKLIPEIQEKDLIPGGAGVRAQACDRNGKLIDDFDILRREDIIHVRNAPSPAATSCLAIGRTITEQVFN